MRDTADSIANLLNEENADFVSIQEADSDSTRTYHVDETKILRQNMPKYYNVSACCFDSPFLF